MSLLRSKVKIMRIKEWEIQSFNCEMHSHYYDKQQKICNKILSWNCVRNLHLWDLKSKQKPKKKKKKCNLSCRYEKDDKKKKFSTHNDTL